MPTEFDQQTFIEQIRSQGAEVRLSKTGNVLIVDFRPAPIQQSPLDLNPLKHFDKLRELYLLNCPVDDRFLALLAGLEKLQTLDLRQTKVSETGIAGLAALPNLKLLLLSANLISETFLRTFRTRMIGARIVVE